jgi:exosortase A-associated hydrolase 2
VVQRDLYGCGDSSGDFADASWAAWLDDVDAELRQTDTSRPVWLWCVRAGALLASAALVGRPHVNLLLWQPVTAGARHLQQFLRMSTGARVLGAGKGTESSPAQSLRAGAAVEVGGYMLDPALAVGLEQSSFDLPADFAGRIVWFELLSDQPPQVSPAAMQAVERLRARGIEVEIEAVTGPAFWQTQEIEESEELLRRSFAALARPAPPARGRQVSIARSACGAADDEQPSDFAAACAGLGHPASPAGARGRNRPRSQSVATHRVGSHRRFVLLAPDWPSGFAACASTIAAWDSGATRTFEDVGPDLHAAIDALQGACATARRIVVWGLPARRRRR